MTSPLLFQPLTLRGLTVRNRAWLPPMCQYAVDSQDGIPSTWHLIHYGSFAVGASASSSQRPLRSALKAASALVTPGCGMTPGGSVAHHH
ncbi:2,4-dienoyl-CoA reductase [Cutibacterium acnes JCM 18916]|nr:2,4-dienoyl-CoA reductase [Cutibacterium acnes JCM 18916]